MTPGKNNYISAYKYRHFNFIVDLVQGIENIFKKYFKNCLSRVIVLNLLEMGYKNIAQVNIMPMYYISHLPTFLQYRHTSGSLYLILEVRRGNTKDN